MVEGGSAVESPLRDSLMGQSRELATEANAVWQNARDIHDYQATKDGMKNGRDHVEAVEINMWKLVTTGRDRNGQPYSRALSPDDLFLLSMSACCHDFDKAYGEDLKNSGFVHGEGSGEILSKNREKLGIRSEHVADTIADIVRIHDHKKDFGDQLCALPEKYAIGTASGDLRLLALVLKAADTLHLDHTRVHEIQVSATDPDPVAKSKTLARKAISGWYVEGETIYLRVKLKSQESAEAFEKLREGFVRDEWEPIAPWLERYGFPYKIRFDVGLRDACGAPPSGGAGDHAAVPLPAVPRRKRWKMLLAALLVLALILAIAGITVTLVSSSGGRSIHFRAPVHGPHLEGPIEDGEMAPRPGDVRR